MQNFYIKFMTKSAFQLKFLHILHVCIDSLTTYTIIFTHMVAKTFFNSNDLSTYSIRQFPFVSFQLFQLLKNSNGAPDVVNFIVIVTIFALNKAIIVIIIINIADAISTKT